MIKKAKKLINNTLFISIVLHILLLLLILSYRNVSTPDERPKPSPQLYVPSYVASGGASPTHIAANNRQTPHHPIKQKMNTKPFIATQEQVDKVTTHPAHTMKQSILATSLAALQANQHQAMTAEKEEEPIYLVGDDSNVADPLIKLMGKALSAHFEYPRVAGELGIRGRVIIKFTLHPAGHISDIQVLRSSDSPDLDAAALYAVNMAPTIAGAHRFITDPKRFVVGFIFR